MFLFSPGKKASESVRGRGVRGRGFSGRLFESGSCLPAFELILTGLALAPDPGRPDVFRLDASSTYSGECALRLVVSNEITQWSFFSVYGFLHNSSALVSVRSRSKMFRENIGNHDVQLQLS